MPVITAPKGDPGATFNGGTVTGDTTFDGVVTLAGTDPNDFVFFDPGSAHLTQQTVAGTSAGAAWIDATGNRQLYIFEDASGAVLYAQNAAGTKAMWIRADALTELRPVIIQTAAPADAALSAGQCALWFDQTNGAAKLMVKGKSANGTVVAASIALA